MRKSTLFLLYLAISIVLFSLMFVHASYRKEADIPFLREKGEMIKDLGLTDLCLFTEASYTRHLSQADLHTPFRILHYASNTFLPVPL